VNIIYNTFTLSY